jgi:RNA polymerase sigma factor (sigma-70 family)
VSDWSPDIARLRAFDDAEWLRVERTHCGRMYAYVSRRIPDEQAREDIVQESFLGAVRGIGGFDPIYTFEQYLFGIVKNRTIDHLRRQKVATLGGTAEREDDPPLIEVLAREEETPSRIVRRQDLERAAAELLHAVLRAWVQETWQQEEFTRLMVIEALFSGGWRNRDTWQRFELRDETSVAGIKFRALKRLRELAHDRDPSGKLLSELARALDTGEEAPALEVGAVWRAGRVSCPARHWLARSIAGTLAEGPRDYVRFHLDEMHCEWCQANQDDLARLEEQSGLGELVERVGASTLQYLRSRTQR